LPLTLVNELYALGAHKTVLKPPTSSGEIGLLCPNRLLVIIPTTFIWD